MNEIKVIALGDACPIPVVKTKNAIRELGGPGQVEVLVDNEIAVQNLTKMAGQKGYQVRSEKLEERRYRVVMTVEAAENSGAAGSQGAANAAAAGGAAEHSSAEGVAGSRGMENGAAASAAANQSVNGAGADSASPHTTGPVLACVPDARRDTVVVISSDTMGSGDDTLGRLLMKGFIFALTQQDELPAAILFYNGGARLTCEDAPTLEDLKSLEAQGVEILTCGTCLNHYGLAEQLRVGNVTNMYAIAEKMMQAGRLVRP